jgi:hypothetical protein
MMAAIKANNKVMLKHASKKRGVTHYLFRKLSHMTEEQRKYYNVSLRTLPLMLKRHEAAEIFTIKIP